MPAHASTIVKPGPRRWQTRVLTAAGVAASLVGGPGCHMHTLRGVLDEPHVVHVATYEVRYQEDEPEVRPAEPRASEEDRSYRPADASAKPTRRVDLKPAKPTKKEEPKKEPQRKRAGK
jgi:hypothetical protein